MTRFQGQHRGGEGRKGKALVPAALRQEYQVEEVAKIKQLEFLKVIGTE